jgi:flagellar basal body-associated protein FliL
LAEEAAATEDEEGDLHADTGPSRLPQFIVLIMVILLGQAAAGYVLITRVYYPGMSDEIEEGEESLNPAERPIFEIDSPVLFSLGEMILNPPDDEGIRFLSAAVTLEFDVADALVELESGLVAAQLQDLVLSKLSQTPFTQMDEASERAALKERLKDEINAAALFETGEVTKVYFERFILQ